MKINGSSGQKPIEGGARPQKPAPASPQGAGPRSVGEQVDLSASSQVAPSAGDVEVPDAERVAKVRAAIEQGAFQIDANAIADRMLAEEI